MATADMEMEAGTEAAEGTEAEAGTEAAEGTEAEVDMEATEGTEAEVDMEATDTTVGTHRQIEANTPRIFPTGRPNP